MFSLIVSAVGTVLGGLFIGFIAMQLIGEKLAKYVTSCVAIIAVLTQLKFETPGSTMGSAGMLLGLAVLLVVLLRPRDKKPVAEA